LGISAAKLIHPIRLAITGKTGSPPIFDVMVMAGKDLMKRRLQKAADYIRQTGQTETCHPQVN
jgi:glutamyl-tRNA synthetase